MSLERIRELLHGDVAPAPARPRQPGAVEVWSHLLVTDGIEVVIEPSRAGCSPEAVRLFIQGVVALHREIMTEAACVADETTVSEQQTGIHPSTFSPRPDQSSSGSHVLCGSARW